MQRDRVPLQSAPLPFCNPLYVAQVWRVAFAVSLVPAEMTLKVDFSVESKMYGFPLENDRFHVSLGVRDLAAPQK